MRLFTTSFTLLSDMFVMSISDMKSDKIETHIVSFLVDEFENLILHLEEIKENKFYTIGFNNLKTEMQLIEYILKNKKQLEQKEVGQRLKNIKNFYDEILKNKTKQQTNEKLCIKHIDLGIIIEEENKTLEHIKASLGRNNIKNIIPLTQKELVNKKDIDYAIYDNSNNISIIKKIANDNKHKLKAKLNFQKIIKKEIINKTPTAITQLILAKALKKNKSFPKEDVLGKSIINKKLFSVKNKKFKNIINQFAEKNISSKSKIEITTLERGLEIFFSKSGIHAAKKGFHTAPKGFTIINLDAKSYFTSIIINSKYSPINYNKEEFTKTLTAMHSYRNNEKISPEMKSLVKSMLSNVSGLSNSYWSDMYDPKFYYSVTINGQLYLYLLFCMLCESDIGFIPLMQNTDGVTFMYKDSCLGELDSIISRWSAYTGVVLTKEFYRQMLIKDVSSYVGVGIQKEVSKNALGKYSFEDFQYIKFIEDEMWYVSKLECKGVFNKFKSNSYSCSNAPIIAKCILNYYFYGTPISNIRSESNISLFLCYINSTENLKLVESKDIFSGKKNIIEGLSRFIVTIYGQKIARKNIKNDELLPFIGNDYLANILNETDLSENVNKYQINFEYYEKEIYKILDVTSPGTFAKQTEMF